MSDGTFAFEDCLLKHYVRHDVWLPHCKKQLLTIRRAKGKKPHVRRLKYFTFCAVGALDVLLLDREKVIRRSSLKEFDTVYFFDTNEDAVVETRKRIPGANGFPGDFVKVVLQDDEDDGVELDGLDSPRDAENTRDVRQAQNMRAQLQKLKGAFPFDVLNLDVEQYLYRPKEDLPGKLTAALRKIFEWQTLEGRDSNDKAYTIDEFTLMFTTQVGPHNLPEAYISYLRDTCLAQNLAKYQELVEPYNRKASGRNVQQFFTDNFDEAFKLTVPKSLIELALENDWHVDGDNGVEVYEFHRESQDGPYCMLHMAMTVRRQAPPRDKRAPGQPIPALADAEHKSAVTRLFMNNVVKVEDVVVGEKKVALETDLQKLFAHRLRYFKPETTTELDA